MRALLATMLVACSGSPAVRDECEPTQTVTLPTCIASGDVKFTLRVCGGACLRCAWATADITDWWNHQAELCPGAETEGRGEFPIDNAYWCRSTGIRGTTVHIEGADLCPDAP